MRSRRPTRSGAVTGGRGLFGLALGVTLVLLAKGARAETFRYVDRQGRVHNVEVKTEADPPPAEPPPAPAATTDARKDLGEWAYLPLARDAARAYSVPLPLVLAVMKVESGFNSRAVSEKGAQGLMQLMPATAADLGVVDPFDPRENIRGGARYLRSLMDSFGGDTPRALAAYHAGVGRVRKSGGAAPFETTRRYVACVLQVYRRYQVSLGDAPPALAAR